MTFGSMLTVLEPLHIIKESVHCMLQAANLAGVRAIIQAPWHLLDSNVPTKSYISSDMPNVLRLSRANHEQIFPHCSAIVHHGGAGTTHAALVAGRPTIVIPHAIADQGYWGQLLYNLGVAATPLPRYKLTEKRLAQLILHILANPRYMQRAQFLGAKIAKEKAVDTAIYRLEKFVVVPKHR